jgi:hypothetical protein
MPTALIERKHVGGMCVNEGCTPTESMVAGGRVRIPGGVRWRLRSLHGPDRRRPADPVLVQTTATMPVVFFPSPPGSMGIVQIIFIIVLPTFLIWCGSLGER